MEYIKIQQKCSRIIMNYFIVVSIMPDKSNLHMVWRACRTPQAALQFCKKANKDHKKLNPNSSDAYMVVRGYENKNTYIPGADLRRREVVQP